MLEAFLDAAGTLLFIALFTVFPILLFKLIEKIDKW